MTSSHSHRTTDKEQSGESPSMAFTEWLAEKHPDVVLTPMQQKWAEMKETHDQVQWSGGKLGGKTFVGNLWEEYCKEVAPRA